MILTKDASPVVPSVGSTCVLFGAISASVCALVCSLSTENDLAHLLLRGQLA